MFYILINRWMHLIWTIINGYLIQVFCVLFYWTASIFGKTIVSLLCSVAFVYPFGYIYTLEWCLHFYSSMSRSLSRMYTNDIIIIVFTVFVVKKRKKKVHLLFRYIFTITKSVLGKNWLSHGHVNLFCHFFSSFFL
jgi:hypothetical protein